MSIFSTAFETKLPKFLVSLSFLDIVLLTVLAILSVPIKKSEIVLGISASLIFSTRP